MGTDDIKSLSSRTKTWQMRRWTLWKVWYIYIMNKKSEGKICSLELLAKASISFR